MAYGTGVAAKLTGMNRKTLQYWVTSGLITPSVNQGTGTGNRHKWGFRDLVELQVIYSLRKEGVSLQKLREVRERLQGQNPLAEWLVKTANDDVFLVDGDEVVSLINQPGQVGKAAVLVNLGEVSREVGEKLAHIA